MKLVSSNFESGKKIPRRSSKDGGKVSPLLAWPGVSNHACSLALIVDDSDAPKGISVHSLLCGLSPPSEVSPAAAGSNPPDGAQGGPNGFGETRFGGPKPPERFDRQQLDPAMYEHIPIRPSSSDSIRIANRTLARPRLFSSYISAPLCRIP
jgi:phosphatidylethanolamine-binding protein (PEBP) family uncharacterized protein